MHKYLYILTFLMVVLVGCDQEKNNTITTTSENRVNVFSFYEDADNKGLTEVIYKVEHLSDTGRIYCADSLRYGTRLDSVVPYITYKSTPAMVQYHLPDTVVISTGADTLDFSRGPIYLMVQATDTIYKRWYRIDIHAHKADPDLYVWRKLTDAIFAPQNCDVKAFCMGDVIYLLVNNGFETRLYWSNNGHNWYLKEGAPLGLPTPCAVRDILQCGDILYYTEGNFLYTSKDVLNWSTIDLTEKPFAVLNMLMSFDNKAWCVLQDTADAHLFLGVVANGNVQPVTEMYGLTNGVLPATFPVSDFASLPVKTSSERPRAMVIGGRTVDGTPVNTRWNFEYEPSVGYRMVDFSIEQPSFNSLTGVSVIQYDNQLIMFGGIDNDLSYRSNILYSDDEGMNWYLPDTAHNQLPENYNTRQQQTVVISEDGRIYLIGGKTNTYTFSDVYCGYKNQLIWETQKND